MWLTPACCTPCSCLPCSHAAVLLSWAAHTVADCTHKDRGSLALSLLTGEAVPARDELRQ